MDISGRAVVGEYEPTDEDQIDQPERDRDR
jgi:hypothetical protein